MHQKVGVISADGMAGVGDLDQPHRRLKLLHSRENLRREEVAMGALQLKDGTGDPGPLLPEMRYLSYTEAAVNPEHVGIVLRDVLFGVV